MKMCRAAEDLGTQLKGKGNRDKSKIIVSRYMILAKRMSCLICNFVSCG